MAEFRLWCKNCALEVATYEEEGRGSILCFECNSVLEESGVVTNQVTFGDDNRVVGQLVRGSGRAHGLRGHTESRDATIRRAKDRIRKIAVKLKMNSIEKRVELALNMYKYCLEHGLTRGRKSDLLAGGCLYIICRREHTPHLLLDFSEALKEDIFLIGRTFFQLVEALKQNIPNVEPWVYVERFAAELEFGDKMNAVCLTAMKIISQIKRDWIQTGRRPTSICGAALMIAARIHGFKRTVEQVTKVMRMSATTLTKRMSEISQSRLGEMTIQEINKLPIKLTDENEESQIRSEGSKPPCFDRKIKPKKKKKPLGKETDFVIGEAELRELNELANCETFQRIDRDLALGDKHEKIFREQLRLKNLQDPVVEEISDDEEIDDAEIDDMIISDEKEIEERTKTWDILNSKYMKQFKKRQREKEKKRLERKRKKKTRKRKNTGKRRKRPDPNIVHATAEESTASMLRSRMSDKTLRKIGFGRGGLFSFSALNHESDDDGDDDEPSVPQNPLKEKQKEITKKKPENVTGKKRKVDELKEYQRPPKLFSFDDIVEAQPYEDDDNDNVVEQIQIQKDVNLDDDEDMSSILLEMAEGNSVEPETKRRKI